jgi:Flp pilus assembly protein TadD
MTRPFSILMGALLPLVAGCALTGKREPTAAQLAAAQDLSQQGIAAVESGDWDRAASLLRQSLATAPGDCESRRYLAESLWQSGAREEALVQIETAAQSSEADAALALRAGEMLLAADSTAAALNRANQVIRLDPKLPSAWTLRGRVYSRMNQFDRALADLHRALELRPQDREVLYDIANLYRATGQPSCCLVVVQQLLDTYLPGEEPQQVLLLEGATLAELNRGAQAIQSLLAASRRGPPNVEIFYLLAQLQAERGACDAATAMAQQALAIDATHGGSQKLLAHLVAQAAPPDSRQR